MEGGEPLLGLQAQERVSPSSMPLEQSLAPGPREPASNMNKKLDQRPEREEEENGAAREEVIEDMLVEMRYRTTLYVLTSEYYDRLSLFFVIPILVLGTVASFGSFLSASPIISIAAKPTLSITVGAISSFTTILTGLNTMFSYAARAESFRSAAGKFRIIASRLHFESTKDEMGGEDMDPRTWNMFQDAMLDIMKDLKFFPPPHLVAQWKLEGKLGDPGGAEKRGTPQKIPSEYSEYQHALKTILGVRELGDLQHVAPEEINLLGMPAVLENKLIWERKKQIKMRGLTMTKQEERNIEKLQQQFTRGRVSAAGP